MNGDSDSPRIGEDTGAVEPPAAVGGDPGATPGMAGIERAFLRLTFWQTLLSLAGVFTGAVALYAALTESQAVREQTAAAVWPRVQVVVYESRDAEEGAYPLQVQFSNVGVGPALVEHMRLRIGGRSFTSWGDVVAAAADDGTPAEAFWQETVSRRVLAPGETIDAFRARDSRLAAAVLRLINEQGAVLSYCYCSIFDQCWLHEEYTSGRESDVSAVAACPDFGAETFHPGVVGPARPGQASP